MKSISRFSAVVFLAGILCLAPCAFGQVALRHQLAGSSVLNYAPASFVAVTLGPIGNHKAADHDGGGNGCGNQGSGGGWGWDDGWGGGGDGGGCTPVPEGGTVWMYLTIAGLCCFGAAIVRSRRQADLNEAN